MNWKKSRKVNKCPGVASGILLALLLCARPIVHAAENNLSFGAFEKTLALMNWPRFIP